MKQDVVAVMTLKTVKITMGVGNATSANIGAVMTNARLKMFAMPIEVAPKSVGNILGWAIHTAAKLELMQNRQKATRKGISQSALSLLIKKIRLKPEMACSTEKVIRIIFGLQTWIM